MNTKLFIGILLLLTVSCKKDDQVRPCSVTYQSGFSTETRPIAIAIDQKQGSVFVANRHPSISDFSSKIQRFNLEGDLRETMIDFRSFSAGLYERYSPIDMCIDNDDMFVLVKPMRQTDDSWATFSGFCVFHFDLNGNLVNEFDFSQLEDYWDFSAMAYLNDFIYVTSGQFVIVQIDKNSGQADYIHIPITNDRPYLLVTDMEIQSEERIYITGQAPFRIDSTIINDVSICHISRLDFKEDTTYTFYSSARTGTMAAMLNNPGLAIKDNRYIYLATFYGRSLEIYDMDEDNELILQEDIQPDGTNETLPIDVAFFEDDVYIVDHKNDKVYIYAELK